MVKRFFIGIMILFLGLMAFPPSKPADASSKQQVIIVNKKVNKLAFYENGKLIKTYSVATGKTSKLTPEGTFYIREKIKNRPYYTGKIPGGDPRNPLGDRWLGISAKDNGTYPYGIHGNNNESSIGKYISSGCIRMHNAEIRELFDKVEIKATVLITSSTKSFTELAAPFFKNMDITPPAAPIVNPVTDRTRELTGKIEPKAVASVSINSKLYSEQFADEKGNFKVKLHRLKDGTKITVVARDSSGNVSPAKTMVVIDKTAPSTPKINTKITNTTKEITGTAEANATISVKAGATLIASVKVDKNGKFKAAIPVQKENTVLYIQATDAAKNGSRAARLVVQDVIAPAVPTVDTKVDSTTTEITGKAEANAEVIIIGETGVIGAAMADYAGAFSVTIEPQVSGTVLMVYASDNANNISQAATVVVE